MALRVTAATFEETVLHSDIPVLVDFYSDSCIVCKRLSPVLGALEDQYEGSLAVVKVNTNFDAELGERFDILSLPTLILIKDGNELARRTGAVSLNALVGWVKTQLDL